MAPARKGQWQWRWPIKGGSNEYGAERVAAMIAARKGQLQQWPRKGSDGGYLKRASRAMAHKGWQWRPNKKQQNNIEKDWGRGDAFGPSRLIVT